MLLSLISPQSHMSHVMLKPAQLPSSHQKKSGQTGPCPGFFWYDKAGVIPTEG